MKNLEAITLKAFLFALTKQSIPLTETIQKQLNQIGENLNEKIGALGLIVRENPDLFEPYYENARTSLVPSPERTIKGIASIPDATIEKQNTESIAIENTSQLRENTSLENLLPQLKKVSNENILKLAPTILKSANSVKSAQDDLPQFLDLYL